MITFLAHFKIRPRKVQDFYEFWRKTIIIEDRTEMIWECLCEVPSEDPPSYITWKELSPTWGEEKPRLGAYRSFLHISMWKSAEAFERQVAHHFDDRAPLRPFEVQRRVRTISEMRIWRMGEIPLPRYDSGGVL